MCFWVFIVSVCDKEPQKCDCSVLINPIYHKHSTVLGCIQYEYVLECIQYKLFSDVLSTSFFTEWLQNILENGLMIILQLQESLLFYECRMIIFIALNIWITVLCYNYMMNIYRTFSNLLIIVFFYQVFEVIQLNHRLWYCICRN